MYNKKITFVYFKRIQKVLTKTIPQIQMFSNQIHMVNMKIEIAKSRKSEVFNLITRPLILAHFEWGGNEGEGYDSLSLWMVEDKSYGNPNP